MSNFIGRHRGTLLAILTVVAVALMIWLDSHRPPAPGPVKRGDALPAATLSLLGGRSIRVADLKGRPAVLDFWATWCGPCRQSLPHLNELAKKYGDKVGIYAVDGDSNETVADIAKAKDELGLRIPVATNGGPLAEAIGLEGFPTTVVLDKSGHVAASFEGITSPDEIAAALDKLL